jgi:cytochrome c-type biogenesis protein
LNMEPELSLLIVFAAGLLSFLSPCVLPLIPGYIAFVAGLPIDNMTEGGWTDKKMASAMLNSVMFVVGFSAVFVLMGASATWLGGFLVQRLPLLISIAGVVIIIFGLQQIGLFKFGFMLSTKQIDLPAEKLGPFKAPLLGAAFAFGWTPCVGPILAAILTYAATMDTVGKGVMLLIVYSAGHEGIFQVFFKNQKIYESHSKNQRRDTGAFRNTDDNRKFDFNNGQTRVFKQIGLVARDTNLLVWKEN